MVPAQYVARRSACASSSGSCSRSVEMRNSPRRASTGLSCMAFLEPDVKLWIDADATPREVKEIVFRAAHRLNLDTVLVANQRVPVPPGHPTVAAVRVAGGPDVADL